jgi:hypothetical protein
MEDGKKMVQFVDLRKCYVQMVSAFWMTLVHSIVTYSGFSALQIAWLLFLPRFLPLEKILQCASIL